MLLWALASVSLILLAYEMRTLVVGVLWPLLQNPAALQTDFHYYYDAAQRFSLDASRLYLASDDFIAGFAYPPLAILPFVVLSPATCRWGRPCCADGGLLRRGDWRRRGCGSAT